MDLRRRKQKEMGFIPINEVVKSILGE